MQIKNKVKNIFPWSPGVYHKLLSAERVLQNLYDSSSIVLLYHRVVDLRKDPQMLAVGLKNFEEQVQYLKNNYPILRFEENLRKVEQPSIVITFDDGYIDNFKYALPILEKHQVPATVFISTGNIGKENEFWWDDLERIILLNANLPRKYTLSTSVGNMECDFQDKKHIYKSYQYLHPLLKKLQFEERRNVLQLMNKELQASMLPREIYRTMNKEEICEMDKSPYITIGGHTITHTCLANQSIEEQRKEIFESKKMLEDIVEHPIETFSYPFGGKVDYTCDTVGLVEEAGYRKAASNYPGQVHSWSKKQFEIPRCIVRNWNLDIFKKQIESFFVAI